MNGRLPLWRLAAKDLGARGRELNNELADVVATLTRRSVRSQTHSLTFPLKHETIGAVVFFLYSTVPKRKLTASRQQRHTKAALSGESHISQRKYSGLADTSIQPDATRNNLITIRSCSKTTPEFTICGSQNERESHTCQPNTQNKKQVPIRCLGLAFGGSIFGFYEYEIFY